MQDGKVPRKLKSAINEKGEKVMNARAIKEFSGEEGELCWVLQCGYDLDYYIKKKKLRKAMSKGIPGQ